MAHYRPLQRTDGRWDYVCTNDAGTFAIGYCYNGDKPFYAASWGELSGVVQSLYGTEARWEAVKLEHLARLPLYHNCGHLTAEQAVSCYRHYEVLETAQRREDRESQKVCAICGNWTQHRVLVGSEIPTEYALCRNCDTTEHLMQVHGGEDSVPIKRLLGMKEED